MDSGLRRDLAMAGRATIDVNQYRVRGRFSFTLTSRGDLTLEFTSTSPMGGRREDVVFSFWADTLRVFDRERGDFYEGLEVDELAGEGMGFAVDMAQLVRRVTARSPDCRAIADVRVSGGRLEGRVDGERFRVSVEQGRARQAEWPAPFGHSGRSDVLEVDYGWRGDQIARLTVLVPDRSWRIRLEAE